MSQFPDDVIHNVLHFFRWQCSDLFGESTFINHHNMGASGEAPAGQIRITFSKHYIAGDIGMFRLSGKRDHYNCLKLASVDRIPLNYDYRSFIFRFGSF